MLSPAILEPSPGGFCENTSLIGLLNLFVMHELERSAFNAEYSLGAFTFDAILEVSKLLPVEVKVVLWIVLVLNVLRNLLKVCDHISWVCFHDVVDQELDELFLR